MKPGYRIFWIMLIVIASAAVASAQAVFSVEQISYVEYANAEKEFSCYNVIPADSIADNEIVSMVLKESQAKFERIDSVIRQEIYYVIEADGVGFNKQRLLYLPELKLYGFVIPDSPHEDSIWWFDSESGKYICSAACPTVINANGMYVSQIGYDCDWPLDLRFFRREGNDFYEFESYKSTQYNGEPLYCQAEESGLRTIFWHDNNTLYLKTIDHNRQESVYLKMLVVTTDRHYPSVSKAGYKPYKYDNGDDYVSDGRYRIVDSEGKIGYATQNNVVIIQPRFAFGFPFKDGRAKVTDSGHLEEVKGSDGEYHYWVSDNWYWIDKMGNRLEIDHETDR